MDYYESIAHVSALEAIARKGDVHIPYSIIARLRGQPYLSGTFKPLTKTELADIADHLSNLNIILSSGGYEIVTLKHKVMRLQAENEFMINLLNMNLNSNFP